MRKLLSIMMFNIILIGCYSGSSTFEKQKVDLAFLKDADKIIIYFYGKVGNANNSKYYQFEVTDINRIGEIVNDLSGNIASAFKCGYHGKIEIYKNREALIKDGIEFNIYNECAHFAFLYQGKIELRKMTDKLSKYLNELYDEVPFKIDL